MDSLGSSMDISLDTTLLDSISSEEFEEKPQTDAFIDKIMSHYLRHNLSLVGLEDLMKLLNERPDDCDQFPTGKKQIIELFRENRDLLDIIYFVKCNKCKKRSKIDSNNKKNMICETCENSLKMTETNFFVYMPIEQQIMKSIESNWSRIREFNECNVEDTKSYCDAHDGAILKDVLNSYSDSDINVLSLCLNLDGANKFKSNKLSVWPMQLGQNYLPPDIRFKPRNIIVAGLYYTNGDDHLNCREFLLPLVNELIHLKGNKIKMIINNDKYTFKPVITHCAVDLPAKGKIQELKQHGGYHGCTYCYIRGEPIEIENLKRKKPNKNSKVKKSNEDPEIKQPKPTKCVRYVEGIESPKLRNEIETLQEMLVASTSSSKEAINGVKDVSCLVGLEHFNIIKSIGVEYMHCVLQGITKRLVNFFVNPKYKNKAYYIAPKTRTRLNMKILAIKPTANFVRMPRSLDKRSDFKASEYRFLLLYYLPVCWPGCVPKVYIEHVRLLSAAVYILLKSKISIEEVDNAEKMLKKFVKEHQTLFGKQNMVMVVHLLKHLADSVRHLGPLWCHSAFSFERNNGCLLKLVNGTSDVLQQISTKYSLLKSTVKKIEKTNIDNKIVLGKGVHIVETLSHVLNFDSLEILNFFNVALHVYVRIKLHNTIYTSLLYTRPKKSIDYFIALKNQSVGMVKYYFEYNEKMYVMMTLYEVVDNIDHLLKVQSTNRNIMAPVHEIDKKCVYMKLGIHDYIVYPPNPYETE